MRKLKIIGIIAACVLIIVAAFFVVHFTKNVKAGHATEVTVTPTPVNLDSLRAIGHWQLISVEMNEVVDTIDKGLFSNKRISVGYHGTLRYGIDLSKVREDWVRTEKDTIAIIVLPRAELLDNHFLDERNVKVYDGRDDMNFINKPQVRAALVKKAKERMASRGEQFIPKAQDKAGEEMQRLFHSHGYKQVNVSFAD